MFRRSPLIAVAVLALSRTGAAQEPSVGPSSTYTPPAAASLSVTGVTTDSSSLTPDAASMPLRLSMLATIYPAGPAFSPGGCSGPSVAAAGTIFPTQPYARLLLTPRLVLHGFSDLGCPGDPYAPLDAGAGGGLTYASPLRPNLWLVGSGGAYWVPGQPGLPARVAAGGGLDLVTTLKDGRSLGSGFGLYGTGGRGVRALARVTGSF